MQVIGHRGAAALAPENTWASFDAALAMGVDAIETDIRSTSDGVLVLMHDALLDRTTGGTGPVAQTAWSTVSQLDAGSWFDAKFAGLRVPRLDDMLERYGRRTHIALEIKQPGIESEVLDIVRGLQLMERITFTSFDFATAERIKREDVAAKVGFLTPDISHASVMQTLDAGLDQFCPPADAVTRDLVLQWRSMGLEVRAWSVRDTNLMTRAVDAGVDGMTVDFPHLLLQALGRG